MVFLSWRVFNLSKLLYTWPVRVDKFEENVVCFEQFGDVGFGGPGCDFCHTLPCVGVVPEFEVLLNSFLC